MVIVGNGNSHLVKDMGILHLLITFGSLQELAHIGLRICWNLGVFHKGFLFVITATIESALGLRICLLELAKKMFMMH